MQDGPGNFKHAVEVRLACLSCLLIVPSEGVIFSFRVVGDVEVEGIHSGGRIYSPKDGADVTVETEESLLV